MRQHIGLNVPALIGARALTVGTSGVTRTPIRKFAFITLAALLLAGSFVQPDRALATYPGTNGLVVITKTTGIVHQNEMLFGIYALKPGAWATYEPILTSETVSFHDPVLSPDGSKIAFRMGIRYYRLGVVNVDGTGLRELSTLDTQSSPTWSPDGRRLAFGARAAITGRYDLHVVNLDGSGLTRITDGPGHSIGAEWAAGDARIFYGFSQTIGSQSTLYSVRSNGTDPRQVSSEPESGFTVSPDGETVAVGIVDEHGDIQIHVMTATGGDNRQLTSGSGQSQPQSFSPDGSRILFYSNISGDHGGFYHMATDGSDVRTLAEGDEVRSADWGQTHFVDAETSKFRTDIYWALDEKITVGCRVGRFCPKGLVNRDQLASFVVRALKLPAASRDYFTDDNGNKHEGAINALAQAGITVGCGGTRYCPKGVVNRDQLATFMVRAFDLPPSTTDYYSDDDGNKHEPNINALAASDITRGCGPDSYCPDGAVTREQMTAFLRRASR